MYRHANEISRKALTHIYKQKAGLARFNEMAKEMEINERDLSKNLFWLEEHHLVKLSTSIPAGSTFPQIVVVRLTKEGLDLVSNTEKFSSRFPLDEPTTPTPIRTYKDALLLLRDSFEADSRLDKKSRRNALTAIDVLLAMQQIEKKIGAK